MMHNFLLGPPQHADGSLDVARRAQLLIALSMTAFVSALLFVAIFYFLAGLRVAAFAIIDAPFIGITPLVWRWTRSLTFTTHYYTFTVWSFITGVALLLGGFSAPGFPGYTVLILGAGLIIGRRACIIWTGISVITVVLIEPVRSLWPVPLEVSGPLLTMLSAAGFLAVLVYMALFAFMYISAQEVVLEELRGTNQRTSRLLVELEEASARLVRSSEQFLGSSKQPEQGIVGQMMQTARAGHETIEGARESIQGMIEQYRKISQKVQELYRHSQTIVELVSTIDRISGRLDIMALNVGIEAAQAGSSGKQFTILAEDMRVLAERVIGETKRIKLSLHGVNKQVQEVLESSAQGQGLTEVSAKRLAVMLDTFDKLYAFIETTEGSTERLTAETLRQLDAVRQLLTSAEGSRKVL